MRIVLVHDRGSLRRWHLWLADAIAENGRHEIAVAETATARPFPSAVGLLQALEKLIYRHERQCANDLCNTHKDSQGLIDRDVDLAGFDLVVDLSSGGFRCPPGLRVMAPLYNGIRDELAAIDALLSHQPVVLGICDSAITHPVSLGRAAADQNKVFASLDNISCRAGALLLRRIEQIDTPLLDVPIHAPASQKVKNVSSRIGNVACFFLEGIVAKAASRLNDLCGNEMTWCVGWRKTNFDAICETGSGAGCAYARVPNNKAAFFADPFVIFRDGRHYVFVEEFLFGAGKGVISVFSIEADGTVTPSRVVLERSYHLSYPFVFEHAGEIWMIPESYSSGRLELYRAEAFPDRWSLEAILARDISAYDATLCEQGDRLWLLMATSKWQHGGLSSRDTLEVYHAKKLQGPWEPLVANPVLIDSASARPAGRMYWRGGSLWRPAQDCSQRYGGGLTLCRVEKLDLEGFEQTATQVLMPSVETSARGVHTLNHAHGVEVIDVFGVQSTTPIRLSSHAR